MLYRPMRYCLWYHALFSNLFRELQCKWVGCFIYFKARLGNFFFSKQQSINVTKWCIPILMKVSQCEYMDPFSRKILLELLKFLPLFSTFCFDCCVGDIPVSQKSFHPIQQSNLDNLHTACSIFFFRHFKFCHFF